METKLRNLTVADLEGGKFPATVILDDGFTCRGSGTVELFKDKDGTYFECAEGRHYIDGQLDDGDVFIGISIAGDGSQIVAETAMDLAEALQIVLDLANCAKADEDEEPEAARQHQAAIHMVEDMTVNQFGDD